MRRHGQLGHPYLPRAPVLSCIVFVWKICAKSLQPSGVFNGLMKIPKQLTMASCHPILAPIELGQKVNANSNTAE